MFVTQDMINRRLQIALWTARKSDFPIGLHAMPRCKSRRFAGVGIVNPDGSDDPKPFFDVYVGIDGKLYPKINRMLRRACVRLGQRYVDME